MEGKTPRSRGGPLALIALFFLWSYVTYASTTYIWKTNTARIHPLVEKELAGWKKQVKSWDDTYIWLLGASLAPAITISSRYFHYYYYTSNYFTYSATVTFWPIDLLAQTLRLLVIDNMARMLFRHLSLQRTPRLYVAVVVQTKAIGRGKRFSWWYTWNSTFIRRKTRLMRLTDYWWTFICVRHLKKYCANKVLCHVTSVVYAMSNTVCKTLQYTKIASGVKFRNA